MVIKMFEQLHASHKFWSPFCLFLTDSGNEILMRGIGTNVLPVPGPWDVLGL